MGVRLLLNNIIHMDVITFRWPPAIKISAILLQSAVPPMSFATVRGGICYSQTVANQSDQRIFAIAARVRYSQIQLRNPMLGHERCYMVATKVEV